ncbi:MAG TPA: YihY/virulence factor BrkB family protein [Ramlibacter sp.]|jgi:membrane protein|uniref:YihY/virulence factor BrkB family protein n=1 Tax=Ramlibacter sp. TaxID=1917967 RepID=UPI002D25789B|nr:YihY/virulence factor BrkB family protein [Ramlibacter sp.]HZY17360.1 YihY/virulence factor BrkB family protein [Ramlibacter sp.]
MNRHLAAAKSWGDRLLRPVQPLVRAASLWSDAGGMRMSAAMSFYGILSLAPLLLVMVAMLGWWMDREMLQSTLVAQVEALVGTQGAAVVQQALSSAQEPSQGVLATAVGFGVLLFGATGVFGELQEAFALVWSDGGPPPRHSWWHTASLRLRGVAYILAFGFLLLVSLVISTLLSIFAGWAGEYLALEALLRLLNEVASFALCTALFVSLMRLSAGRKPELRFLVLGGVVGAILFSIGRQLLALYLSTAAVVSAYGAAGSLVVLLMWIYFSSAVLLFSAGCAKAAQEAREARRRAAAQHDAAPGGHATWRPGAAR